MIGKNIKLLPDDIQPSNEPNNHPSQKKDF